MKNKISPMFKFHSLPLILVIHVVIRLHYIIAGKSGLELASKIAQKTGWHKLELEIKEFQDRETYLKFEKKPREGDTVCIVQNLIYPQEYNLFQLLNIARNVSKLGIKEITAVCPYLCYSRADREVLEGDLISIDTVISLMYSSGIRHLVSLDIHNPNIVEYSLPDFRITNLIPKKSIANFIRNKVNSNWTVVAPDEGAINRARAVASELGIDYIHFRKRRTGADVQISLDHVEEIKPYVIVVDDIITGGSTMKKVTELLLAKGAKRVNIIVTHIMGSAMLPLLKRISNGIVVGTKSVPSEVSVIDFTEELIEVLKSSS